MSSGRRSDAAAELIALAAVMQPMTSTALVASSDSHGDDDSSLIVDNRFLPTASDKIASVCQSFRYLLGAQ
jgi:hypothetical protein